jgi:PAS domain S-box-containing protein
MLSFSISSSLWGSLVGTTVLFAAMGYLRAMPGAPAGVGYWTAAFGLYVLRLTCYLAAGHLDPLFVTFLAESLQASSTLFLMMGACRFVDRDLPQWVLMHGIGLVTVWSAYTTFIDDSFLLRSIPLYGLSGIALIYAGFVLLRAPKERFLGPLRLVGATLIVWGLHKLNFPWLRPIEWFAPYGFLLAQFLAMTAAVGLLLLTAGRLRSLAEAAVAKHEQTREHLATLNQLLQLSLGQESLEEQLGAALDVVIAAPWLALEPRGGVFLIEDGQLRLRVYRNLGDEVLANCTQVSFGQCICGSAAATKAIVHAAHVDADPTTSAQGTIPLGHYSVPLLSGDEVVGVLLLYLPDGRGEDEAELTHLRAVADVLAGMIVRKRAEADLQHSRRRLVEAQRIARIGAWEIDLATRREDWSDEEFRILGYQPGEIEPSHEAFLARVHREDLAAVASAMNEVDHGDHFAIEHRVEHPDGKLLYVSQIGEIIRDETGKAVRMVGTSQDITQVKATEMALVEAKKGAEAANQAKSAFLATMSHELRTPLNAVIGFAQLLELPRTAPSDGAQQLEYVTHIRESGEHLLSVINDILDISRIEAGQGELSESEIDLAELVSRTLSLLEPKAREGGLDLETRLPAELPALFGDERALRQVLLNLVANAVKFTEPGGRVIVELAMQGGALELSVTDNGIGVSPEDQQRIFEPFVQAESDLSRRYEGTGLGLPLVRSLVELHDAEISLESAVGRGTRVSVLFPPARLVAPAPAKARQSQT